LKPYFAMACGACSRDDPQPKFALESRMVAPEKRASFSHVVEQVLAETVEGNALHEARGDDAIRIDVVARDVHRAPRHFGDFRKCHEFLVSYAYFRGYD
jgi:hypothetical protein